VTSFEVRNPRGVLVRTFNTSDMALRFVATRQDLGKLTAWEVTRTVSERQLIPAAVTPIRRRTA
jgi:hypothetical protein